MSSVKISDRKRYWQFLWRSWAIQDSWNYERQMNMGFLFGIAPTLDRLYPDDKDPQQLAHKKEAYQRHMAFYNCTPQTSAFTLGLAASMEEQYAADRENFNPDTINAVKTSLMGPLAGIGDTVTQSLVKTIFLSVGCSLALSGNILGPILFFIGMSAYALGLSYYVYFMGYNSGKTSITKLLRSGLVKNVSEALGALGMMVLGAMVAANIGVTTPLAFTVGGSEIVLQTILDSILPKMLPLLIFFGTYRLVVKGKKSTYIIAGMFVVGILGSVLHILG